MDIQDRYINLAGDIWATVFGASYVLSLLIGGIQMARKRPLWDAPLPLLRVMTLLHYAWAFPLVLPFLIPWGLYGACRWGWRKLRN